MTSATAVKKHYTYQDYAKLLEGSPYQLIGGDLVMVPAPTPYHQRISRNIELLLIQNVMKNDLGEVLHSPIDVYFSEQDTFQPDIILVLKGRLNIIGETKIEGAPDLIIEILSPSSAYYDLGSKYKVYEKAGVKEYWLIHPDRKAIEVFENKEGKFELIQAVDEIGVVRSELLEGFEVDLAKVFRTTL